VLISAIFFSSLFILVLLIVIGDIFDFIKLYYVCVYILLAILGIAIIFLLVFLWLASLGVIKC